MAARIARDGDVANIIAINQASRPAVAALDRRELSRLLNIGAIVLVADLECCVSGYLIAFTQDAAYDGEEFRYFRQSLKRNFLYVDQAAVDQRFYRRGVGTTLYQALAERMPATGAATLCCEVNIEPPNPVSMAFHRQIGFRVTTELVITDGRTVALLVGD